jgi:XTP/dITP diphosphohydrolase
MKLLIASGNAGKVREFQTLMADLPLALVGLGDVGLAGMDVPEDGSTLEENAAFKAQAYARASGLHALADDSGLFVDALDGAPGVYSARYGGPGLTMPQRRAKLLAALAGLPDEQRGAHFACVIALADPHTGAVQTVRGVCAGRIAQADDDGGFGFGYDSLFIPEGHSQNWSHLPAAEKNRISHRGLAARAMRALLAAMLRQG